MRLPPPYEGHLLALCDTVEHSSILSVGGWQPPPHASHLTGSYRNTKQTSLIDLLLNTGQNRLVHGDHSVEVPLYCLWQTVNFN